MLSRLSGCTTASDATNGIRFRRFRCNLKELHDSCHAVLQIKTRDCARHHNSIAESERPQAPALSQLTITGPVQSACDFF